MGLVQQTFSFDPFLRVLSSIDVLGLEKILIDRIGRRPLGGLLDPVLVLVPSLRLASYLKRRIAESLGAALGVHILTHRRLALKAMECALESPPRVLPDSALAALVDSLVAEEAGPEGDYLRAHAGARRALLSTFTDLREAEVEPGCLSDAGLSAEQCSPLVAKIYTRFSSALERLEESGWTDSTGLVRASLPHLPGFLRRKNIRAAIHHGAYDLIGIHMEMLDRVARTVETELLLPSEIDGPAFAFGRRFAEMLRERSAVIEEAPVEPDPARRSWTDRLRGLWDPHAVSSPRELESPPLLEICHAQGAEEELRAAALRALALHVREGVPLEEVAIVASSLEPYTPFLEVTFEELRIPFTSSATLPLSRDSLAAAFLCLLRVLAGDLERRAVIDLLRRQAVKLEAAPTRSDVNRWDRWTRAARIVSGLSAWLSLREFVAHLFASREEQESNPEEGRARREREEESLAHLLQLLEALEKDRQTWLEAQTFREHVVFLRDLAHRWISCWPPDRADARQDAIGRIIEAIEVAGHASELARGGEGAAGIERVEELARLAAESRESRIRGEDCGGVRVLDLMQARGLSHRVVIWIGFHDGGFPRRAHADYYLGDDARQALADLARKPLAKKLEAAGEERLLLAMTLASARDRFILSFQRADENGQKRARSSALREVARVFTGKPDAGALLRDEPDNVFRPERMPSHPGERALHLATSPRMGLIPPDDAVIGQTVRARRGTAMARALMGKVGRSDASSEAAIGYVECLELFEPGDGVFDGFTGAGIEPGWTFYPSAIERLTRCPLSFFLRDVLGLREIDEEAVPHKIEARALGNAVHETLALLYKKLAEGGFAGGKKDHKERAREMLAPLWRERLEKAAGPSYGRLRGLFGLLGDRWLESLEEFVEADLVKLDPGEIERMELERIVKSPLQMGQSKILLAGRVDRVLSLRGEIWIDDYKTGRDLKKKLEPKAFLTGYQLQLPLYREVVAASLGLDVSQVRARLLGVGPEADERMVELAMKPDLRQGMLETLAVAVNLAMEGRFPLHRDSQEASYCGYCGYRRTCRRAHEPTLARLESDPHLADYRDVRRKRVKSPLLAAIRAHPEEDEGEEGIE